MLSSPASAACAVDPSECAGLASVRGALLLAVALWLPMVLLRDAWPVDETRYADVALAMRESGQWWVPVLHQKWYFEKPPLFFWAIAGLARVGVPIERGPHLVSLLATLATLALLPSIGRACGLSASTVRRGAYVLATAPLVVAYAQLGYIDPLLTVEMTGAVACALQRSTLPRERLLARVAWALLEGVLLAAGLLTKGPVVLLFAIGWRVGACFAARTDAAPKASPAPGAFAWLDLLVLGVAVALALSWVAKARAIAGDNYVHDLIFGQLERRIAGTERKHRRFPGFALLVILVGGLPWSVLALGAMPRLRRGAWRPPPRVAALLGLGVVPSVLIACLPTQQPHYVLPALPALALLAGERLGGDARPWARRSMKALGGVFGVLLVVAAAVLALRVPLGSSLDPTVADAMRGDRWLQVAVALAGALLLSAASRRSADTPAAFPKRTMVGAAAFLLLPIVARRADRFMAARDLSESPAVLAAKRLVAPTGLRSALRLSTRLPRIEEYDHRKPLALLREDAELIAIVWMRDLAELGLVGTTQEVARGWLQGSPIVALRAVRP